MTVLPAEFSAVTETNLWVVYSAKAGSISL